MKVSIKKGFGFGLTSGIITTLGLIIGLNSSTHSEQVIIGGILTIAVADALSDALGIHISEEAEGYHNSKSIWEATAITFLAKLVFASTFVAPILLLPLKLAIIASVIWGLALIFAFSFYMAKQQGKKPYKAVVEHLVVALLVILATNYIGKRISEIFSISS